LLISSCFAGSIVAQNSHVGNLAHTVKDPDWVTSKTSSPKPKEEHHIKWTKDPFDRQLFVENKGQFDADIKTSDKILYQAILGDVKVYFISSGVTYKYTEPPVHIEKEGKGEMEEKEVPAPKVHFLSYIWSGASSNVTIDAEDEQSYYYIYATGKASSVNVNIFKKIIYHNIYPGIDIEYSFIKGKSGMKYSVIAHPGADVSQVKLVYNGAKKMHLNSNGDAVMQTEIGEITDHAPVGYYQKGGQQVACSYKIVNGDGEVFSVNTIAGSNDDLIIDPWTTDPAFTGGYDRAYDVDYDQFGNVYAYGSYSPYQLTKFNSAGVQQWTFNATGLNTNPYYGDFAVDKVTGTSYMVEGFNLSGAGVLKVNTLGSLVGTFPGNSGMIEMWRCVYNPCTRQVVIGGGGTNSPNTQACLLDTGMVSITPVNPLGTTACCHDVCLIAMDPTGSTTWMAVANTADPAFGNSIMSLPVPAFTPANYITPDGFAFQEVNSIRYVGPPVAFEAYANGMNGMAASPNWLYAYDGATLKQINKATGAINASATVTATSFKWGGCDADGCDNAYVGENTAVEVYSSALALTSTIPLKDTVFDVVLGANYTTLYAGGVGYVSSVDITNSSSIKITNAITPTPCGSCAGSGTPTLLICGSAPIATPTYLWAPGGQTTQTATGLCKGTYTVTLTLGCGEKFTDTLTIPQGGAGSMTLSKTQNNITCFGVANGMASVTASNGTGPYVYSWAPSGGTSSNTAPLGPGTYTVTVNDAACHSDTAIYVITQPAQLRDSIVDSVEVKCFGGVTGSATVAVKGGTGVYSYSWASSGGTNNVATNLAAGPYTVTVTDANSCKVTASITLTQPTAISPVAVGTNALCSGGLGSITTTGTSGGTPVYTYKWSNGATTSSITAATGPYTVTITDANSCTATATVSIISSSALRDSITSIVEEPCFGDLKGSLTLGVKGGTGTYNYVWTPTAQTSDPATGLAAGNYKVVVTDGNGCKDSANGTITEPSKISITAKQFSVTCHGACNGQLVSLVTGGTGAYAYNWSNGATMAGVSNVCPGTYSLVVTDGNGCTADTTGLIITEPTAITGTVTPVTAHCSQSDGSACVNAAGGTPGYTYAWSNGNTATCMNNVPPASYTVIITDANKCNDTIKTVVSNLPGDTAVITSVTNVTCNGGTDGTATGNGKGNNPPFTYSWSTATTQTTQTATGLSAGVYTLTVTDAVGCKSTVIANITEPALVVTTPGPAQTICIGQSTVLTVTTVGGTPGYTYTWMPGSLTGPSVNVSPTTTTTYTISTADANNCPGANVTIVVTVHPPLSITISPNEATCPGGSVSFTASAQGGDGTYTYSWLPSTGLNTSTGSTVTSTPTVSTEYKVIASDGCGTAPVTDSAGVIIDPLPIVKFTADTLSGCSPLCVDFTNQTTIAAPGKQTSWAWSFGDGGTSVKDTPTKYCYQDAGVYTVALTVISDSGCKSSLTIPNMITVYSHPVAAFSASPQPATIIDPTINFVDESTDAYGIKSWLWKFGDPLDGTSTIKNPSYTYTDTGTYCVMLTVTNIHSCQDSVNHCEIIEPYYTFYIPNAFTPNGNGLNDVFNPKGTYICDFKMYIYDRWGMQMFYTNDMNKGWNGNVNGSSSQAQEDTYIYMIEVVDCVQHKKHQYLGKVSLIK